MNQEQWDEYCKRSKYWAVRVEYGLLHSKAFSNLTYGPGLKVLLWAYERRRVSKTRAKRGRKKFVVVNEKFSFTFQEAILRGMSQRQFWKAIRVLIGLGFLDLIHQGSGLHRDYSVYCLSERWKKFGEKDFEQKEIPKRGWGFYRSFSSVEIDN